MERNRLDQGPRRVESLSDCLAAMEQTADQAQRLSAIELRQRIDAVAAFLTHRFGPATVDEEVGRLTYKLGALRERLVHSYFGPAEVRLLQGTLDELRASLAAYRGPRQAIPA